MAIIDTASGKALNLQGEHLKSITPSDTVLLNPSTLYVGTGGDVNVLAAGDTATVIIPNFPSGQILPVQVIKVLATSTIASGFVLIS